MKNNFKIILGILIITSITSCSKDITGSKIALANQMIADKVWYLDYKQTSTGLKSYIGASTFYVKYLKDLTYQDSDGLTGTYSVEMVNNQLQIHVQQKTSNGNSVESVLNIEQIGDNNLNVSYTPIGATSKTIQYFSAK